MSLSPQIPCQLSSANSGWFLTFPKDPGSGLLFSEPEEKIQFAADCAIALTLEELEADWIFAAITSCAPVWLEKAQRFNLEPF